MVPLRKGSSFLFIIFSIYAWPAVLKVPLEDPPYDLRGHSSLEMRRYLFTLLIFLILLLLLIDSSIGE